MASKRPSRSSIAPQDSGSWPATQPPVIDIIQRRASADRLGIAVKKLTPREANRLWKLPGPLAQTISYGSLIVTAVAPDSPAARAGIEPGYIFFSLVIPEATINAQDSTTIQSKAVHTTFSSEAEYVRAMDLQVGASTNEVALWGFQLPKGYQYRAGDNLSQFRKRLELHLKGGESQLGVAQDGIQRANRKPTTAPPRFAESPARRDDFEMSISEMTSDSTSMVARSESPPATLPGRTTPPWVTSDPPTSPDSSAPSYSLYPAPATPGMPAGVLADPLDMARSASAVESPTVGPTINPSLAEAIGPPPAPETYVGSATVNNHVGRGRSKEAPPTADGGHSYFATSGLEWMEAGTIAEDLDVESWGDVGFAGRRAIDLGGVEMEFVVVPRGEFQRGSPLSERGRESDEGPIRLIRIAKPFCMSKYEVTQEQYTAVMTDNPSSFKGTQHPVENVSWEAAMEFCRRLSARYARVFRLPTEAEWEFACRSGTQTRYFYGDDAECLRLQDYAWYFDNSSGKSHPVGEKMANGYGFYDMHGNVLEWCLDHYNPRYYKTSPSTSPAGPSRGTRRAGSRRFLEQFLEELPIRRALRI